MRFSQVDVFSTIPLLGNPLAVVHDADALTTEQMAAFARWTNLSETTFLLEPSDPGADYRVRIFTTGGELPFAGHPTLGSCAAWLAAGGVPRADGIVVQECGAGPVTVHRGERLAFEAPQLTRSGPVDAADLDRIVAALRLDPSDVLDAAWCDNGPGWIGIRLGSAEAVLAIEPDPVAFGRRAVGVVGPYDESGGPGGAAVEVRAFYSDGREFGEDPVTGSLNAALAQWLIGDGTLPESYVASQGARLDRAGLVHVSSVDGMVLVGGDVVLPIVGEVDLAATPRE